MALFSKILGRGLCMQKRYAGNKNLTIEYGWYGDVLPLPIDNHPVLFTIFLVSTTIGIGLPIFGLKFQICKQ